MVVDDGPIQYPGDTGAGAPPGSAPRPGEVVAPAPGDFIELGQDAVRQTPERASAQTTGDTLLPPDDFFRARDAVEARFRTFNALARTAATASAEWTGVENVVGVGVGFRYASDALTGDIAVKVFVREKLPMAKVSTAAQIPAAIDGIPTDVEPTGDILLHAYTKRYPRPVPCGVSISNERLPGSGTLGALVVLRNRKLCFLSNNHVIANENAANVGDRIIQPGNAEPVAGPDQVIGVLESFIPIKAAGNLVDAGVAWTSLRYVKPDHVTYRVNPLPVRATLGMTVMKNGRTTESTLGVVTDLGVNILVAYDPFPQGAEMRDQIAVRGLSGPFSKQGDSGSLIVTVGTKQPVALLFAGANDNSVTFANTIQNVMEALQIDRFL
jgi:hypothetical protein